MDITSSNGSLVKNGTSQDQMELVRKYDSWGWALIEVPPGEKNPGRSGWQAERNSVDDMLHSVARSCGELNIGRLNGAPSGVVDVDLDTEGANALAPSFLPHTACIFGRSSKPRSHWQYRVDTLLKTEQFASGEMIVEIRSTGSQTIVPPSIHSGTGEQIQWDIDEEPALVDGSYLRTQVGKLAAAVLLARFWQEGVRHAVTLSLSGGLAWGGWSRQDSTTFVGAIASVAGDDELPSRLRTVEDTFDRFERGETVTGFSTLSELIDSTDVARIRKWLGVTGENLSRNMATNGVVGNQWQPEVVTVSDVTPTDVSWLWAGRIPLGKVTVLDGDPGTGKSTITIDLAARTTTGEAMPDGTFSELAGGADVLLVSYEDGVSDTIQRRLVAAGARLSQVHVLTGFRNARGESRSAEIPSDTQRMEEVALKHGVRLIVIDPLMAALSSSVDAHKDQHVRKAMTALSNLAERTGAAVVVVRHLNKSGGNNATYRGGGSIGIIGAARSGLMAVKHPEDPDRRLLAVVKSNLATEAPTLEYRLVGVGLSSQVEWVGESSLSANDSLLPYSEQQSAGPRADAKEYLLKFLADEDELATIVYKATRAAGLTKRTVDRAKQELGIRSERRGYSNDGEWFWVLERDNGSQLATLGQSEHQRAPNVHTLPTTEGPFRQEETDIVPDDEVVHWRTRSSA